MTDKTIKQLAEQYGISKQAIRARLKKLPKDCYKVDTNGTIYITEKGCKTLDKALSSKNGKPTRQDDSNVIDTFIEQLKEKDKQIAELHKLLDQAQQLQAMAENKIKLLEEKQKQDPDPQQEPKKDPDPEPVKKSWFRAWF